LLTCRVFGNFSHFIFIFTNSFWWEIDTDRKRIKLRKKERKGQKERKKEERKKERKTNRLKRNEICIEIVQFGKNRIFKT
jgi:F0F1-type ATP synthase epsilon subunit